jgi:hypothetical protein
LSRAACQVSQPEKPASRAAVVRSPVIATPPPDPPRRRGLGHSPVVLILALTAAAWFGSTRSFVAEDSYFYLVAARRLALDGHHSFSGVMPSNGFHPLWLYLLTAYSWIASVVDRGLLWHVAFAVPLSLSLVAGSAWMLRAAECELDLPAGSALLPPLVFVSTFGVLYSEAHVLLASLSWLLYLIARAAGGARPPASIWGLALGVVVLARLDMALLAIAVALWLSRTTLRDWGDRIAAAAAGLAVVGPYVAANLWFFGGAVPISGWLKSSFPTPTPSGFSGGGLSLSLSDYAVAYGVIPIAFSLAVLLLQMRRERAHPALALFATGACAHMVYTMSFASWCGWHWYYVLPVFTGSLAWAFLLRDAGDRAAMIATAQRVLLVVAAAVILGRMVSRDNRSEPMRAIQARLASPELAGKTVFVSELPGEGAFLGRANVVAADMLTGNRIFYDGLVAAPDPWAYFEQYCAQRGAPVHEIIYAGGEFVRWDGADELIWLDPKVSSRRPLGRIATGTREIWRRDVPFAVWRAASRTAGQ